MGKKVPKVTSEDLNKQFTEAPTPIKAKVVQDMVMKNYSNTDIAELFGVSPGNIQRLRNIEVKDEIVKQIDSDVEDLNRMKDIHIKALTKDLELKAMQKLNNEIETAKFSETLKAMEMLSNMNGKTATAKTANQTNIQIIMPESVKKKFNLVPEETPTQ